MTYKKSLENMGPSMMDAFFLAPITFTTSVKKNNITLYSYSITTANKIKSF